MKLTTLALPLIVALAGELPAETLSGTLRYAGRPTAQALPAFRYGKVALQASGGEWILVDVDTVTSSWTARGLAPGWYQVWVALAPVPFAFPTPNPGTATTAIFGVNVRDGGGQSVTLDLLYNVHITRPFDNLETWPGQLKMCPYGPATPRRFTLEWEAVPHAVRYQAVVRRWSCEGWIANTVFPATGTSVEVVQNMVPGEAFLILDVHAFDASGRELARMPIIRYRDGTSTSHYAHESESSPTPAPVGSCWCLEGVREATMGTQPRPPCQFRASVRERRCPQVW